MLYFYSERRYFQVDFEYKDKYNVNDLVEIVKILRSPNGCPWDKVQTHQTIRQDFIEEVYEAVEAIDENDTEHLREELGDVLLQVVFHCVLEEEKSNFDLDDAANDVCQKMILRHPHVFGNIKADTPEEVLANWDKIKMESKAQKLASESMESVSKTLPSLMRAQKLNKKAERGGLSSESPDKIIDDISEQLEELKKDISENKTQSCEEKIGDILFMMTGLSKVINIESEKSLYNACGRFIEHFKEFEENAEKSGVNIQNTFPGMVKAVPESENKT